VNFSQVTIAHRTPFQIVTKKMNIVASSIACVKKNSVVLENGVELPCDTLILGTGKASNTCAYCPDLDDH